MQRWEHRTGNWRTKTAKGCGRGARETAPAGKASGRCETLGSFSATLCLSNKNAISINERVIKFITEDANAALSKALPPPLTEYLKVFSLKSAGKKRIQSWLAQYQLKKNASEDVSDMMMQIATTGELNFGCIQPSALGNMFRSPSI
jgi:hypothetical protein